VRRADNFVSKSGSLSLLEPLGPVQACYRDCFTFTHNNEKFSEAQLHTEKAKQLFCTIVCSLMMGTIKPKHVAAGVL
jgi:hypothetical protein